MSIAAQRFNQRAPQLATRVVADAVHERLPAESSHTSTQRWCQINVIMVLMADETRMTLRLPTDLADYLRERAAAENRSLNSEIVHLLDLVRFPVVDADAHHDRRRTIGALPTYSWPRPYGRRPRGGG